MYRTVTPLKKDGFINNVTDLRPISILPLPAKILEKLIHSQLMEFLNTKDLLSKEQGGFRPGFLTNSTVALLVDDVYTSMNNQQIMQSIFIDFSKAFDTIDHSILLRKLQNNYLYPNSIALIKKYLTNRKQQVIVNDKVSGLRIDSSDHRLICPIFTFSFISP